jgi:hypothetical protein
MTDPSYVIKSRSYLELVVPILYSIGMGIGMREGDFTRVAIDKPVPIIGVKLGERLFDELLSTVVDNQT